MEHRDGRVKISPEAAGEKAYAPPNQSLANLKKPAGSEEQTRKQEQANASKSKKRSKSAS
jgi:hypothetical protein